MFNQWRGRQAELGSEFEVRIELFISVCFLCRPTRPAVFGLCLSVEAYASTDTLAWGGTIFQKKLKIFSTQAANHERHAATEP